MEKELLPWGNSVGIRFLKEELKQCDNAKRGDKLIFTVTKVTKKEESNGRKRKPKK